MPFSFKKSLSLFSAAMALICSLSIKAQAEEKAVPYNGEQVEIVPTNFAQKKSPCPVDPGLAAHWTVQKPSPAHEKDARRIVALLGPNFPQKGIHDLKEALTGPSYETFSLGDGVKSFSGPLLDSFLKAAAEDERPTTIFVLLHGATEETNAPHEGVYHTVSLAIPPNGTPNPPTTRFMDTETLFGVMGRAFAHHKAPVDLVMVSCESGSAVTSVSDLPKGWRVALLASPYIDIDFIQAGKAAILANKNNNLTADGFVDAFLAEAAPYNQFAPTLLTTGTGEIETPTLRLLSLKKPLSNAEKKAAYAKLKKTGFTKERFRAAAKIIAALPTFPHDSKELGEALLAMRALPAASIPIDTYLDFYRENRKLQKVNTLAKKPELPDLPPR